MLHLDGPEQNEQFPAPVTVCKYSKDGEWYIRWVRRLTTGKERIKDPNGKNFIQHGDVFHSKAQGCLVLRWKGEDVPIPIMSDFMVWTLDSICPTPDGDPVEPDHPESWLSLVGLV